jgi:hypothetical protein
MIVKKQWARGVHLTGQCALVFTAQMVEIEGPLSESRSLRRALGVFQERQFGPTSALLGFHPSHLFTTGPALAKRR